MAVERTLPDLAPSGRASSQNKPAAKPSLLSTPNVALSGFGLPSSSVAVRAQRWGSLAAADEDGMPGVRLALPRQKLISAGLAFARRPVLELR